MDQQEEKILKCMLRLLDEIRRNTSIIASQAAGKPTQFKPKPDPEVIQILGKGPVYDAVLMDEMKRGGQ